MMCLSERNPLLSVLPMSLNDQLTQLYNREGFVCAAECLLSGAGRHEDWACLLTLQVDHWDVIDQALGRETLDRFLRLAGGCLREVFQYSAVIGRVSPARFAVLFLHHGPAACNVSLKRLNEIIDRQNDGREIELSLRGGFSRFESRYPNSVAHLLSEAEQRLEASQANGGRSSV